MKPILCLLFCYCFIHQLVAQSTDLKIVPPSPSVSELGRAGIANANLSDGAFHAQVPLYEYKTSHLSLPISLSYSTNGFKVDKVAGRTGMDWGLIAGGSIGRMVLNFPDETKPWVNYPSNWPSTTGTTLQTFISNMAAGNSESVPDIYNFNFNGHSGRFVIINGQIIKLEQNSLDIQKTTNGFEIIDNNGIKYVFTTKEQSHSYSSCSGHPYSASVPMDNAWMLTSITHPLGDVISFRYKTCDFTYSSGTNETFTTNLISGSYPSCNSGCPTYPKYKKCITSIRNYGLLIDRIYSSSRGFIQFNYTARIDLPGDSAIESIVVYDGIVNPPNTASYFNTTPIKKFQFTYEISGEGNPADPGTAINKRMFLIGISESGQATGADSKNYGFGYNDMYSLPFRLTNGQDHFGFYNGKTNPTLIPQPTVGADYSQFTTYGFADRTPDYLFAQKGTLSKIIYPTGGTDSVIYEPHTVYKGGGADCGNLNVSTFLHTDGTSEFKKTTKYYSPVFTTSCAQTVSVNLGNVTLNGQINYPEVYYQTRACLIDASGGVYIPSNPTCVQYQDINGSTLIVGPQQHKVFQFYIPAGTYRLKMDVVGPSRGYVTMTVKDNMESAGNKTLSGIRVKEIISKADSRQEPIHRKFYYSGLNSTASSAIVSNEQPFYKSDLNPTVFCQSGGVGGGCQSNTCSYRTYSNNSFYSMYTYGSNHVYYAAITEDLGDDFASGAIEHLFYVAHDVNASPFLGTLVKDAPLQNFGIMNGYEYSTTYYKAMNNVFQRVKKVETHYKHDSRLLNNYTQYYFVADPGFGSNCLNGANTVSEYYNLHIARFDLLSRWIYPDSVSTTEYGPDGSTFIKTIVVNQYDNTTHQQLSKVQLNNSNGSTTNTTFLYSPDVFTISDPTASSAKTTLQTKHMYAPVLKKQLLKGTTVIKEEENYYSNSLHTVPVLNKVYESNLGGAKELKTEITQYDAIGNVLEAKHNNILPVSYLWDYKQTYPIAEVKNATNVNVAHTSFEADGKGNFTFAGTPVADVTAPAGGYKYNLSSGSVDKSGLTSGTTYIVSYWAKVPQSVNSAAPLRTGKLTEGWTYYEHEITGATTATISGAGDIDDIRLYPKTAVMNSFTYLPLIGLTSKSDASSQIAYYKYDGLLRLKSVHDQDKNIIQLNDYTYRSTFDEVSSWQPTGTTRCKPCPANTAYQTNLQQMQYKDNNPASPTYNQLKWVDNGTLSSCELNGWANTADPVYCKKTANNNNTGQQVQLQKDFNPCSGTYNETRENIIGVNTTACPLTVCPDPGKKLINYDCVQGLKVYTSAVRHFNAWTCTYHWEWPDGTSSTDYTETSSYDCMLL